MGMFDYVIFSAPCIKCGEMLNGFQSKSAYDEECLMRRLRVCDVEDLYDNCEKCGTWNEYRVKPAEAIIVPQEELEVYQRME